MTKVPDLGAARPWVARPCLLVSLVPMTVLELSRWQFGITTVYHFIFVPLTIGLSLVVACMQTAWMIKKDPVYLRMTKFFGKIFLINFAVGVVTGIVQEFQFGMNWSAYSQFVGNVFGAPLAMEALLAFFMESTFIGLWIFGWNRLSPRLHLATIWLAAIGTSLSAYFILAANSWMQHPVGYQVLPGTHRVILTSIWALLTNSTALAAWPHVWFAVVHGGRRVLIAVSAWHVARKSSARGVPPGHAARPGRHAGRRDRDRGHRRRAGPAHGLAAADEDGGRRGPLQHLGLGVVLAVHHRLAERQQGTVEHPRARPALADRHPEPARHRPGHQQRRGAPTPRSTGRGSTSRSSRSPTGRSASWSASACWPRCWPRSGCG